MIVEIGHIQVGSVVHHQTRRSVKSGVAVCAVGITARRISSGQSRDYPIWPEMAGFPDGIICAVRHVEIPRAIHGYSIRTIEARRAIRPIRNAAHRVRAGQRRY